MNFVGHVTVGLRVAAERDDPTFLVGAALPDFAAMGRARLTSAAGGSLARGIAFHHATDKIFHVEGWFLHLERELRGSLVADGLPDGPARACAHVGPELLLDGVLLRDAGVAAAIAGVYDRIGSPADEIVDLVPPTDRDRWRTHLVGVAGRLDPLGYRDPGTVARRLHGVTARRPRLAFDGSHLGVVTERLREIAPHVAASADDLLDRVVGALTRPRRRWGLG